ncbi:hypothetical protein LIER_02164 [Lithospermum erythrorhizon]|uniref:Uncharacterized protein n=1 Tax=Lithospermum erythrorhizon TaxID=34254 RepID=A0AAV3NP56_LITER
MLKVVILFSFLLAIVVPSSSALNSRKLEDGTSPRLETKHGGCPCNNGSQSPPTPSTKPMPPPSIIYPPPPSSASGGSNIYPSATPPSQNVYINGPPGKNLYTVDPYYTKNGACPITPIFDILLRVHEIMLPDIAQL